MNPGTNRIHILLIIDGLEFGGGERVFLQLAKGLQSVFDISVAATPGGLFEEEINKAGIRFFAADMTGRFSIISFFHIKKLLRKYNISLIHSQGARADFLARMVCGIKIPHVCTLTTPVEGFDVRPLRKKIYRFADYISELFVDKFIVVSDELQKLLICKRKISPCKVVRIYNGIETDLFKPEDSQKDIRKKFGISPNMRLVAAIGRMVWEKGFDDFIRAVPFVVSAIPNIKFLFVGEGPCMAGLISLSEKSGIQEHVIFTGFRKDVKEILSGIEILVVPSLLEGCPMVTLEAMAMEKTVIASNIPGISEQISDGENGRLIPPKDSAALSKVIIEMLNDSKSAGKMGKAARKRVEEKFSVARMLSETGQVYRTLLKKG